MAVVQISRIQVRRGRKLEGSGMPQLASGELGWAIDTQELYIGNGSVSEGAPAVGNTKLLTEYDSLLDFASQYSYRNGAIQTGEFFSTPVYRSLQERLDERVSLLSFGSTGDGTDHAAVFQRAFDQLYLNPVSKEYPSSRMVLYIPPGEYYVSKTIMVPAYATIIGAGKNKTILHSDSCTVFQTVNSNSEPDDYALDSTTTSFNQPRDIIITGMTINNTSLHPSLILKSCKESLFQDLSFTGSWESGDNHINQVAIRLDGISTPVSSNHNRFINIDFDGYTYPVYSDYDVKYNLFQSNSFTNCRVGVMFGLNTSGAVGQLIGPSHNTIENSIFDKIDRQGFFVAEGQYNTSKSNRYLSVGNDGGSPATAVVPLIQFNTSTNVSEMDFFERSITLAGASNVDLYPSVKYIPDVKGRTSFVNNYANTIPIGYSAVFSDLIKLPIITYGKISVEYVYTDVDIMREGVLEIICDATTDTVTLNDVYNFLGAQQSALLLDFKAELADLDNDTVNDTIIIKAKNTIPTLTNDTFFYTIKIKS